MDNFWEIGTEEIYSENGDVLVRTNKGEEIPFDEWAE